MRWNQRVLSRSLFRTVMAVSLVAVSATASHATKYWKNTAGSGNWNVSNNWSAVSAAGADNGGVPLPGEAVNIVNSDANPHTVTLNVDPPTLGFLSIDYTGAGAGAIASTSGGFELTLRISPASGALPRWVAQATEPRVTSSTDTRQGLVKAIWVRGASSFRSRASRLVCTRRSFPAPYGVGEQFGRFARSSKLQCP